jgi:hypothetical protein
MQKEQKNSEAKTIQEKNHSLFFNEDFAVYLPKPLK